LFPAVQCCGKLRAGILPMKYITYQFSDFNIYLVHIHKDTWHFFYPQWIDNKSTGLTSIVLLTKFTFIILISSWIIFLFDAKALIYPRLLRSFKFSLHKYVASMKIYHLYAWEKSDYTSHIILAKWDVKDKTKAGATWLWAMTDSLNNILWWMIKSLREL